jgi:hypothetical protein
MSASLDEPARLKERRDQSNLIERIAAQALRDLPREKPLSTTALARIADNIDSRAPRSRWWRVSPAGQGGGEAARKGWGARWGVSARRYGWVFVTAAFVLGIAAAASAERLGAIPRWLTGMVTPAPRGVGGAVAKRTAAKRRAVNENPRSAPADATTAPQAPDLPAPAAAERPEPEKVGLAESRALSEPLASGASMQGDRRSITGPAGSPRFATPTGRTSVPFVSGHPGAGDQVSSGSATSTGRQPRLAFVDRQDTSGPPQRSGAHAGIPIARAGALPASPSPWPFSEPAAQSAPVGVRGDVPVAPSHVEPSTIAPRSTEETVARPAPARSARPQATRYLTQAVRALRVEHSPESALLLLDRHAQELSGNAFSHEALLLRVEAMLSRGRRGEVLRLLDSLALIDASSPRALLLMRGQLRAEANRCAESVGDFSLVLAEARRPPRPALLGRALCRNKLGDREGARADAERYRREFPGDPAIDDVERTAGLP